MRVNNILSFLLIFFTLPLYAQTSLLKETQKAQIREQIHNQEREAGFLSDEKQLTQERDALLARKAKLEADIASMSEGFTSNEQKLAEQEKKLLLESGSLGELFGVVRQAAKEFQAEQTDSVATIGSSENLEAVNTIARAEALPSKAQLYALWSAFSEQITKGSEIERLEVPYVDNEGVLSQKEVLRLGAFGLVDENGFLNWAGSARGARPYDVQPESFPKFVQNLESSALTTLDPTGGRLLEQLSREPTLSQRIEQGGAVGTVILTLLAIGLLIGFMQGAFLLASRLKIRAQLKDQENIKNNALGRVLGVYKYDKSPNVEALELRLYETVMDEQQKLERGLSMLKLLAALAPMLGLLGTVTGMIETFQVITQFGNADPRMMASGISTALVTTVLGLVAAMPLLFIHNVLSSQAENIRIVLEKQGVGLVAQRAEQDLERA